MASHDIEIYAFGIMTIVTNIISFMIYKKLQRAPLRTFIPWYKEQLKSFQKDIEDIFGKELAGTAKQPNADKDYRNLELISNLFSRYTSNATLFLKQPTGQYIKKAFFGINPKILDKAYFTGDSGLISFFRKTGQAVIRNSVSIIIFRKPINPQEKELIINEMKTIKAESCFPIGGGEDELYGFLGFGKISYDWNEHDELFFTLILPLIISSMFSTFEMKKIRKSIQLYNIKDRRKQEKIQEVARVFSELVILDGYSREEAIRRITAIDSFKYDPDAIEILLEAHNMGLI